MKSMILFYWSETKLNDVSQWALNVLLGAWASCCCVAVVWLQKGISLKHRFLCQKIMQLGSWYPTEFLWDLNCSPSVFLPVNTGSTKLLPIRRQCRHLHAYKALWGCICHCKGRAVCCCMLINDFLFAALHSRWVAVLCEWPVSALGTAGLRNQLGVSEWICFQPRLSNHEWAEAAICSQNLPTAGEGRNWEKLLQHREIWDRAGPRCNKGVKEALAVEQELHGLDSCPTLQVNASFLKLYICRGRQLLLLSLLPAGVNLLFSTLPPLLPLGTYLKFFLCWAQASWSLRGADCNLLTWVPMKTQAVPRTTFTVVNTLLVLHRPLCCSTREERGGLTLNIAVFKGYNNTFFAFLLIICWLLFHHSFSGVFFPLVFFSLGTCFPQFRQNHYFHTQLSWLHEEESDCIIHLQCSWKDFKTLD